MTSNKTSAAALQAKQPFKSSLGGKKLLFEGNCYLQTTRTSPLHPNNRTNPRSMQSCDRPALKKKKKNLSTFPLANLFFFSSNIWWWTKSVQSDSCGLVCPQFSKGIGSLIKWKDPYAVWRLQPVASFKVAGHAPQPVPLTARTPLTMVTTPEITEVEVFGHSKGRRGGTFLFLFLFIYFI